MEGTVEVESEQPLNRPVIVTLSLSDAPACRDSVELGMGPPRAFHLGSVPCGSHALSIRTSTSRRFTAIAHTPSTFECVEGRTHQLRVVLEPR